MTNVSLLSKACFNFICYSCISLRACCFSSIFNCRLRKWVVRSFSLLSSKFLINDFLTCSGLPIIESAESSFPNLWFERRKKCYLPFSSGFPVGNSQFDGIISGVKSPWKVLATKGSAGSPEPIKPYSSKTSFSPLAIWPYIYSCARLGLSIFHILVSSLLLSTWILFSF